MTDVKWIKIVTDIFDNRKIKLIRKMPEGAELVVTWFQLLCLAGETNDNGLIYVTKTIPYTEDTLSAAFDTPLPIIRLALDTFQQLEMITIYNSFLCVSNWEKYQNVDGLTKIREQTRKRMQDYRTRQRLGISCTGETCAYCGGKATTIDHLIPKSSGGLDTEDNMVPCCKSCNSSKKDKPLSDFLNDSFVYQYQNVNHELVRSNDKIMKIVQWDGAKYSMLLRNVTEHVTHGYATELRTKNKELDIDTGECEGGKPPDPTPKQRKKFVPPTVDEVSAYCRERKNGIDPNRFIDHYTANGWKQGRGKPIVDWKAAVRTWEREGKENGRDKFAGVV